MSELKEREPDGGLAELIEFYEEMGGEDDAKMLVLLLELRRHRLNSGEREAAQQSIADLEARLTACKWVKDSWKDRAWTAEEELARRDAAAGEPVACLYASGDVLTRAECNDDRTFAVCCKVETPLYTAAQPSALPPEEPPEGLGPKGRSSSACQARGAFISGWKAHHDAAKALGCKAIKLPEKKDVSIPFAGHRIAAISWNEAIDTCGESLKAQGFTVEGE